MKVFGSVIDEPGHIKTKENPLILFNKIINIEPIDQIVLSGLNIPRSLSSQCCDLTYALGYFRRHECLVD
jgi:hypothetical protein